jgi:hypothetical protein
MVVGVVPAGAALVGGVVGGGAEAMGWGEATVVATGGTVVRAAVARLRWCTERATTSTTRIPSARVRITMIGRRREVGMAACESQHELTFPSTNYNTVIRPPRDQILDDGVAGADPTI